MAYDDGIDCCYEDHQSLHIRSKAKKINFILVLYKKEIMLKGIKRVNIFVVLHRTCYSTRIHEGMKTKRNLFIFYIKEICIFKKIYGP